VDWTRRISTPECDPSPIESRRSCLPTCQDRIVRTFSSSNQESSVVDRVVDDAAFFHHERVGSVFGWCGGSRCVVRSDGQDADEETGGKS